ncbi:MULTISPECIES: NAD/NADP-dependent octopine/nopaline dehydrogenase family protein [unclassified Ensifer]|uniref:NAD/NADP-dependent octopine/nopaline dehydrogenase family protein n=1 Tax=unclassified Ensifer TaxID=2633371 RepID=UPI00081320EA|nr:MULTISPECIES: NAD/NADP-dependent octopine/nopaline dehydrogenase family protein [unclassified Ensifer]OCP23562.1 NAD/NADP octopine/nopaline dehydrogenase [Ensifer sp. LC384]OCP24249.1 NAD/NADP octopine/nopaline dehydrogenase [Ensifer sp. LC54]
MKVGIAGAGSIAMGYAALLVQNGHEPMIWSRSAASSARNPVKIRGAISAEFNVHICANAEELSEADVIVLALPAYGHRFVLDALLPHLTTRHSVIISAHLSFAALYLARKLAERSIEIPITAWSTTVLTCKPLAENTFNIGAVRAEVDMATVPSRLTHQAHGTCVALFGNRFAVKDDILTIALSNLNPQDHMGIALCNLSRIERAEDWGQNTNVTPAVGRFLEALDLERLAIASAFGKKVRSTFDHFRLSFDVSGQSVSEISSILVERGSDPAGPKSVNTRYVLEDIPFGLIPILRLAQAAGVSVPLHEGGVRILSACYARDFSKENDLLPDLGPIDLATLRERVVNGYV